VLVSVRVIRMQVIALPMSLVRTGRGRGGSLQSLARQISR